MSEIAALLAELDCIEDRCAAGEWEAAAQAMTAHEQRLRALVVTAELSLGLRQVLNRQKVVERNMRRWRDEAAAILQSMRQGKQASKHYEQDSRP